MSVLKFNLSELTNQLLKDLKEKFGKTAEIEIRMQETGAPVIFEEEKFWKIIDLFDWSKNDTEEMLKDAVEQLAEMPVVYIYLFADLLSEKLWQLNTKAHADNYKRKEASDYFSVDDFLYVRCAVIAEGKSYFEKILNQPSETPTDIIFEPILQLAAKAYHKKTGKEFRYTPTKNFETSMLH